MNCRIHESSERQSLDIILNYPYLCEKILSGLDCDYLPGAFGEFGDINNPIPVNGPPGEIKYLNKLRYNDLPLFYHRIGNTESAVTTNLLDIYVVVSLDGSYWDALIFDMYHPRRSNLAPIDLELKKLEPDESEDTYIGFGTNQYIPDFPQGLYVNMLAQYGECKITEIAKEYLQKYSFRKPIHWLKPTKKIDSEGNIHILNPPMKAREAIEFQIKLISEIYGTINEDWKMNKVSLMIDNTSFLWEVKVGEEINLITFDISYVGTGSAFENRMMELFMLVSEYTNEEL